jgi:NTP pyrophosphatase (non-canonical NTP hydrolase)
MDPKEYIKNVLKTESLDLEAIRDRIGSVESIRLDHAADGLCTESGEFKDALKKFKYYGRNLDRVNLIEELGDVLWYVGIAIDVLGTTFGDIMEKNIAKLKLRYGDKFSSEKAVNRDLEAERDVLENKSMKDYDTDGFTSADRERIELIKSIAD